jgi:hypothetical protein
MNDKKEEFMDGKKIENEIKLSLAINWQLKMINVDNREEIVKKIVFICEMLGIRTEDGENFEMLDDYYETRNHDLEQNKFSLRKRSQTSLSKNERDFFLTIKSPTPLTGTEGMVRYEYEKKYGKAELDRIISDTEKIVEIIKKEFGTNLSLRDKLLHQLTIKNMRTSIPLFTDTACYSLCLDKYYFFSPYIPDYSEYKYEIEIEKPDGLIGEDHQLKKLHIALTELCNYTDSKMSKYKTACKWLQNPTETMSLKFTVMFDIVGYSLKSASLQKNNIQLLNRSLKQAIKSDFGTEHQFVYLPTGDGLILIMDKYFEKTLSLCYQTQKIIKNENATLSGEEKVEFRTGLNVGHVFKYSDINDSLNFAGDGINMVERVTGIGNAWNILATEEFYSHAKNMNVAWLRDLYDIGEYSVKHGRKIRVYNIYSNSAGTGNPCAPEKIE